MKRANQFLGILLLLVIVLNICACSGPKNDEAEVNEVKSYLKRYYWCRYVGGTYHMVYIYEFESNGTYTNYEKHSASFLDTSHSGTYQIDTNKHKIKFYSDGGNKYEWTYSLQNGNLKIFDKNANEYTKMDK